jgi:dipeptidyl-peptidase-4
MTAPEPYPRQHARTRRFTLGAPRDATVVESGRVVYLRSRAGDDPETCLWVHDGGASRLVADPRRLLADPGELPPAERARRERAREAAGGIVAYALDRAGRLAALALAGQLFVVDLDGGTHRRLAVAGPVFDPRPDPAGERVAYVSDRDLRVVDLATGADRCLAGEDDPDVSWGSAEFVAAEEMGRTRGFWWSPDGGRLLATRVDVGPVATWWIGDPAQPERQPTPVRYPAAGTANAVVDLVELGLDGSRRPVDWDGGGRYEYLADVVWQAGHPPLVVRQTRDQRRVAVSAVDGTGAVSDLRVIEDDTWVELVTGSPTWAGDRLVTVEDRGDARRVCVDGRPLGPTGLQVRAVVSADPGGVVVTATADPTELHVHRLGLDGTHRQLTHEPGVHQAVAAWPVVWITSATTDRPGTRTAVHRAGGAVEAIESRAETPTLRARPRFLRSGGRGLHSALLLPAGHDGESALPVLCDPYGGPHALRVVRAHNAHLGSQWLADAGFAVLVTDGRGTPARGPAWERAVHGDLAGPVLDDQLEALDEAAAAHPFLDLDRVAIRGWSFGGYLAALAVLRRPDRFHAAVAGAPVTTWRLYDTHYTERYLGHPAHHPDHYDRSDLVLQAGELRRPLLLIHGLADDNVVAAHTLRLSSSLLAAGRPHSVLPLPGVTHMTPQEVVAENLLLVELDFLFRALARSTGAG